MKQFALFVLLLFNGMAFTQYNPFETSYSDTLFNAKKQPAKITFYDETKKEVGVSLFQYHENDSVKLLKFKGNAGEIYSVYNEFGHLLESTTQRGTFVSKYTYDYEYDDFGQLLRVRGYNTGGLLFISNRYSYKNGMQTKVERFNTSDQLFDWTDFEYDENNQFVSSITFNADTLLIKARKQFQLTQDGKPEEYLIKYAYQKGCLSSLEVFPSDVTFGEMREAKKTVVFHVKDRELKSFTYFEPESSDDKGQIIIIDDQSKNHPIVKEYLHVMSLIPDGFSENVERSVEMPNGIH